VSTEQTDFRELLESTERTPEVYSGVTPVEAAARAGDYQKNLEGLQKPSFALPKYQPPKVRRF
jgi:hypothetical protein